MTTTAATVAARASERTGLQGCLELVCGVVARGRSSLRHQAFRAPVHLSKPHEDAGALIVNVVNPTAGLLEGDRLRIDVRVERGARLLLTTPSATRVHSMQPDGGWAEVEQRFQIAAGGGLEYWPELLIVQRGARYRQQTQIEQEAGAELIFFETLAPGRVASGEVFAFDEIRWATDLRLAGRLSLRERYRLSPHNGSLDALRRQFPTAYYASAFVVSPVLGAGAIARLREIEANRDGAWVGVSQIAEGAFAFKCLAPDSLSLRRTLGELRRVIYRSLGRNPPDVRRPW